VVRARDIQLNNMVGSDLLADAKIEVTGNGVVADKQGPGIGTRILVGGGDQTGAAATHRVRSVHDVLACVS
jgi:hypothetical protein